MCDRWMHGVVGGSIGAQRWLSCIAVAAARSSPTPAVDQLARNDRLGHSFIAHVSVSLHLRAVIHGNRAPACNLHFKTQLIPGLTGLRNLARSIPVNIITLSLRSSTSVSTQRAARLRNGFHDQDARHDGKTGKMSHEEGLIDGYVLDGNNALFTLEVKHAVNQ